MIQLILRALNAPGLILLTLFVVAFQTTLFEAPPLHYVQPDIVLLLVIWCALRRNFLEGGILTLIMAHITELHSSTPQGFFLISYMLVYILVRTMAKLLVLSGLSSLILMVVFSSVLWKLSDLTLMGMLGGAGRQWRSTLLFLVPGAAVEALLSYWAFRWLEAFDLSTFRSGVTEHGLETELQLEI